MVSANHRELLVTLGPTRVVVIERRAFHAVIERGPDLLDDYRADQRRQERVLPPPPVQTAGPETPSGRNMTT